MNTQLPPFAEAELEYPDSDGQPMAENTRQYEWIVTIKGNVDVMYPPPAEVFVAGDLFWYPVQGDPTIRVAPDVLVAFGRPKGHRLSYLQWVEGGVAPQVVFEIRSPGNTDRELEEKVGFYDHYGVEEYYLYDPFGPDLRGWRRIGRDLQPIPVMHGWVSPRVGIRFDLSGPELVIFRPDGQRFLTFAELEQQRQQAEQRADRERQRADQERRRADWLADQLRALGHEPPPPPTNGNASR